MEEMEEEDEEYGNENQTSLSFDYSCYSDQ